MMTIWQWFIGTLRYRYVVRRLPAYLSGELSEAGRRFVARMIDNDPRCYRAYLEQRAVHDEMRSAVPRVGRPSYEKLDALWATIHEQMQVPASTAHSSIATAWQTSMAVLGVVFLLLMPFAVMPHSHSLAASTPQPPERHGPMTDASGTPAKEPLLISAPTEIAFYVSFETTPQPPLDLDNTPALSRTPAAPGRS